MARRKSGVTLDESTGLPTFYARDDGLYRVALHFRVGFADESILTAGISHAVEHLALYPLGQRPYGYNGAVGTIRTTFVVAGTGDEVISHLASVCQNITTLPVDRFATEIEILKNESEGAGFSNQAYHYRLRYGFRGPGLIAEPNIGLSRLNAGDVQRWAREWFVAENAALVVIGPKPLKLKLELPHGEHRPARLPKEVSPARGWARGGPGTVNLSVPFRRTYDSTAALGAVTKRLQARLRYELGLSYDVNSVYEPVATDDALAMVWATGLAKNTGQVRDELLKVLDEISTEGPTRDEMAEYRGYLQRISDDPKFSFGEAERQSHEFLLGVPRERLGLDVAELDDVTRASAAGSLRQALGRAILTIPDDCPTPPSPWLEFPKLNYRKSPDLDPSVISGTTYDHRLEPRFSFRRRYPQLIVGRKGVAFVEPNDSGFLLKYADVAALVLEADGTATIVDERGPFYKISEGIYRNGDRAVRELVHAFPPDKIIRRH